jgi:hypothetical protein
MLEVTGDKNEIPPTVTGRIREALARNIAARNHGITPLQFTGAVTTLLSSLIAARLLEDAGVFPYGSVGEQTRIHGLAGGLSSLFNDRGEGENGVIPPVINGSDARPWPDLSAWTTLSIDPQVTGRVVSLTLGEKFYDEWADAWSDSHEQSLLTVLRCSARLSHDGRMVIGEQYQSRAGPVMPLLPPPFIQKTARDLILPVLTGKTPKNAGACLLDPVCGTGRVLLAMYQVLCDWHLSWYCEHLVPLLEEGRDPASRKVQGLLPVVSLTSDLSGYRRFGTLPLPVFAGEDGRWDLTWNEKIRILGDSLYGIDSDPAAVECSRLSILSYLLKNSENGRSGGIVPGTLRVILSRNIRCGNILIGKDYEERPSLVPASERNRPVAGIVIGDEFPGVSSCGGFGIVFGMFPSLLPFGGTDLQDYLCRHYRSGKPDDATAYYLESGLSLTRPGGVFSGIVAGNWQRSRDASLFRGWLAGYQVEHVVGLGNIPAFTGIRDPLLITISRNPPEHPVLVAEAVETVTEGPGGISFRTICTIDPKNLDSSPWMFKGVPPSEVRQKIDSAGTPLARYILGEYLLSEYDHNGGYLISRHEYENILRKDPVMGTFIHPLVTAAEIRRYRLPLYSRYIVRIPPGTTRTLAGNARDLSEWFRRHHHTLSTILTRNRGDQKVDTDNGCWWEWPGIGTPLINEASTLLTRASGAFGGPVWAIASSGVFPGAGVLAIPCHDPALPGILNSRLAKFYILSSARKKGMPGYLIQHLMKFPVPVPETEDGPANELFTKIARLVMMRCEISTSCNVSTPEEVMVINERLEECDEEIDTLVYRLYGLTSGEIGCIGIWLRDVEKLPDNRKP